MLLMLCGLAACGKPPEQLPADADVPPAVPVPANAALAGTLPALYAGVLPCGDCPGIRYELDLRSPDVYFLRMTYLERPATFDEIGEWSLTPDGRQLVLRSGRETPETFAVTAGDSLRKLDLQGSEMGSGLNYDLTRQPVYTPIEPKLSMRGEYRYMADAGFFEECLTGLKLDVAQEADNAALEAAYLKASKEPGQRLLVNVEGRIARRPARQGDEPRDTPRDTLIVEKAGQFVPNESCGARGVTHDLEGTRWVLIRLGDAGISVGENQREPFFVLESGKHRLTGSGGCNRLMGSYERNGDQLTFKQLALTRMACPDVEYEDGFTKALEATASWKIGGAHLELSDAAGSVLARFESRNL